MISRRTFLAGGALVAGLPFSGRPKDRIGSSTPVFQPVPPCSSVFPKRFESYFISHRGVHLRQTLAGENTLESLRYAKRCGFQCVEFDVRFTKDGVPVVIHDKTINRTLARKSGNPIGEPINVSDLTYDELRKQFVVKCENPKYHSVVPSLEEFLEGCNRYKIIPFIEIKESHHPDSVYHDLLSLFEGMIGRGNFVITSNNTVSDIYRRLGYHHVVVMGILYQTTFEHIQGWGNSIMAISASKFNAEEYHDHIYRTRSDGIFTESHSDTFVRFNQLIRYGVDYISTDLLAPDSAYQGVPLREASLEGETEHIHTGGAIKDGILALGAGQKVSVALETGEHYLYGVFLEFEFKGQLAGSLCAQVINANAEEFTFYRYQILLHRTPFSFQLEASTKTVIRTLRIRIVKY